VVKNIINKVRLNLFFKISLVFVLSLVAILISSITIHRLFFMPKKFPGFMRQMVNHAYYMINEIGSPPDLNKAEFIAEKMKVPIRIEYENSIWVSEDGITDSGWSSLYPFEGLKGFAAGFNDLGFCVSYKNKDYKALIVMHRKREGFRRIINSLLMTLLSFAVLVIIVLFFFIRWLLKPVRVLKEGVDQVSRGNLNLKMPVKNRDELGQLTESFNSMTGRIDEMLQSRDQLLRDVSHELRSPLTRIKVGMELMEDNPSKKGIMDDIAEVETMISELLETDRLNSRFGKLKIEKTNILELLKSIKDEYSGKRPEIFIDEIPGDLELNIDRDRVMILFRNILSNALRYSDADGKPVRISRVIDPENVIITINDSGIGIPEDELNNIFEPFYRVDKSRSRETGGYGLGMSLSKNIMEAHEGKIEISSTPGKGTCVTLIFPTEK